MTTIERNRQIKLSGFCLIGLHLVPGLIFAGLFFAVSHLFIQHGSSGYLALLILIPLCLVPMELGVILYLSSRFTGRRTLMEAITYRNQGTGIGYIVMPLLLLVCWGILSIPMSSVYQYIETHMTGFLPSWTTQEALIRGLTSVSQTEQYITLGLAVILSGFVAPIVEELYFRGFLLPRMEHWGWLAPLFNSFLFGLYHFYFPGNVPGIFLAWVPVSYVVMSTKNWRIGAIFHIMINLWGVYSVFRIIA